MKKSLLLVLVLMICFAMFSSASADRVLTEQGPDSADVLVTLYVPCDFRVIIPERVEFVEREKGTGVAVSVRAIGVYLWNGSRLNVTVRSANGWELCEDKEHYGYTVSKEGSHTALKNGDNVMSIPSGTLDTRQVLDLTLSEDVVTAGEFTDKLTFVLSIDEA